jgi:hypothetical protein
LSGMLLTKKDEKKEEDKKWHYKSL